MALHEMNPRYGRQLPQIVHAETQRTIHHAVDREAMLFLIDLGKLGGMLLHEVERGRCDDSRIILKRGVVGQVIEAVSGASARGLAVDVLRLSRSRLGLRGQSCARGDTGQRSGLLQEAPAVRFNGIHDSLREPKLQV